MSKQVSGARVHICTSLYNNVYIYFISLHQLWACVRIWITLYINVCIYFTFLHQLWARAYMCINFFFNPYFPAEGWCLGNFLENNDASSIFCKSADEKEFSCSPKNTNIVLVLQSTQRILSPSWRETTFLISSHHPTEPFKSARIFTPLMRLVGKFSSFVL